MAFDLSSLTAGVSSGIALMKDRSSRLSPALKGAFWMLLASVFMVTVVVMIRIVTSPHPTGDEGMHPFQITFFRNALALAFMLPWVMRLPKGALATDRPVMHGLRAFFGLSAMTAWFYGVTVMPMAEAITLNFTTPLFATVLAVLILRETVRIRRWSATIIGFIGVLIVLRPGADTMDPSAFIVLFAAVMIAAVMMTLRSLARTETTTAMVFYFMIFATPASLIPALFVWQTPALTDIPWLIGIAICATVVQTSLAQAFHYGEASFLAPFEYTKLPFAALAGWLLFGEVTDIWTWVGAAIIAASTIYIAHREAQMGNRPGTAPVANPGTPRLN